jgi:two-component system OmpR family sensor kinase
MKLSLRTRMVATVLGLATIALAVTTFAGVTLLRNYLTDRLDTEVTRLSQLGSRPIPDTWRDVWKDRPHKTPPEGSASLADDRPGFPKGVGDPAIFTVYDKTGTVVLGPRNIDVTDGPQLGSFDDIKALAGKPIQTASNANTEERFRVQVVSTPNGGYAVAAISLQRVDNTVNQTTLIGGAVGLIVLIGLGVSSYFLVGFGLKPLTRMEQAAAAIAGGDLTLRVPESGTHTETGRLGSALNTMLGRIEAAVAARVTSEQKLRQFLGDASHELRTPLTSIRGFAELYRRGGAPPGPELDETMSRIENEAARMGLLVEDLLLLAELDEERPLRFSKVDLLAVVADTVRDAHVHSPQRKVILGSFEPVTISGDEHRLRQVATNLVTNALQHTPASASVTVNVGVEHDAAVLEVSDTGPGIPPEHASRIFERLYRADPHRARTHGGAGLGLAIASSIVKAHGGRIELTRTPNAPSGATFRILLPLSA